MWSQINLISTEIGDHASIIHTGLHRFLKETSIQLVELEIPC